MRYLRVLRDVQPATERLIAVTVGVVPGSASDRLIELEAVGLVVRRRLERVRNFVGEGPDAEDTGAFLRGKPPWIWRLTERGERVVSLLVPLEAELRRAIADTCDSPSTRQRPDDDERWAT